MKRHELSDQEWELLAPFFPPRPRKRGGQGRDDRTMLNGILWRLNTGAPWRDLPERDGSWQIVHHRFSQMRQSGLLDRIMSEGKPSPVSPCV
jgi:transposase